jgi:hypothetical protein
MAEDEPKCLLCLFPRCVPGHVINLLALCPPPCVFFWHIGMWKPRSLGLGFEMPVSKWGKKEKNISCSPCRKWEINMSVVLKPVWASHTDYLGWTSNATVARNSEFWGPQHNKMIFLPGSVRTHKVIRKGGKSLCLTHCSHLGIHVPTECASKITTSGEGLGRSTYWLLKSLPEND